jgi:zinc/manganese transport system substrate-binding protein
VRVASALPALGEVLIQTAGLDADAVQGCVEAYQAELADAATAMAEELARVPADRRLLVTSHESLGYFADRFGFDIVGTVIQGTSSLAETNPAALESLASEIMATGVPAIFANAEASTADIDALATRLGGVEVVPLQTESLGPPGSGTDTYLGFLSATASTVADALSV